MLIKKSRINKLNLDGLESGQKFIISLSNAERFMDELLRLGFSETSESGECILPIPINIATSRNAENFFISDKSRPKETVLYPFLWKRKEWAGRGETREVEDLIYIPRKRYPRVVYNPYSVEFIYQKNNDGSILITTELLEYQEENYEKIKNTINIFLASFGECQILKEDYEPVNLPEIIRLNWDVLPPGVHPWEKVSHDIDEISRHQKKTSRYIMMDRCEHINSHGPDFIAYGKKGFSGYVIFGFKEKKIYILESIYTNNATYVFNENWVELSKLSKADIITGNLQTARLIHNEGWEEEIEGIIN